MRFSLDAIWMSEYKKGCILKKPAAFGRRRLALDFCRPYIVFLVDI